jgi:ribosomal protein S10
MNWLRNKLDQNRARQLVESVNAWHQTCLNVAAICGDALQNEAVLRGDIGEVLDRADRQLFQFRSQSGEARASVKRQDELLAKRIDQMTRDIYELRNSTARFLIRAQGPGPFVRRGDEDELNRGEYYLKALREAGYKAREHKRNIDLELDALWNDLQRLVATVDKSIKE